MKVIKPSAEIIAHTPDLEKIIELAGRTCYKSEDKITEDSASAFIDKIKNFKHESVLEHGVITVRFVVDRGVSHELVRHRLASFSQESTRYCNYSKDKFNNELTFIDPRGAFWSGTDDDAENKYQLWAMHMKACEHSYTVMIDMGAKPQEARSILPNSLKTEVVMSANPREWRHVFTVRGHRDAHPQMQEVIRPLHAEFARRWPSLFTDITL